jgi:NADPH:quinone reductase-like Zn-dependent oxidoreductase
MKVWRIKAGGKVEGLRLVDEAEAPLGSHQVRLRPAAATLNFRDLMVLNGWYPVTTDQPLVPGSDAAGVITEVGSAVTRVKAGDRVMSTFFPDWIEGPTSWAKIGGALGGGGAGVLA